MKADQSQPPQALLLLRKVLPIVESKMHTRPAPTARQWLRRILGKPKRRWFASGFCAALQLEFAEAEATVSSARRSFQFRAAELLAPNLGFGPATVQEFAGALVDVQGGLCWLPNEKGRWTEVNLQDSAAFEDGVNRHWKRIIRVKRKPPATCLPGPIAPLLHVFGRCFYHWQVECLARIQGIKHYERCTGSAVRLLVPADYGIWARESLAAVGWPPDRILWSSADYVQCERLVIASNPCRHRSLVTAPGACQWLRQEVLSRVPRAPDSDQPPARIYITRHAALKRRVLNEDDLMPILIDGGFTIVALESLSFPDQARIMCRARAVIGPHGGGFTNMIYGRNLSIVEFIRHESATCYRYLASACGHCYSSILAKSVGEDIIVDPSSLRQAITGLAIDPVGIPPRLG